MVAGDGTPRINPTTANLARIDEWLDTLANAVDAAAQSEELTRWGFDSRERCALVQRDALAADAEPARVQQVRFSGLKDEPETRQIQHPPRLHLVRQSWVGRGRRWLGPRVDRERRDGIHMGAPGAHPE